LPESVGSWLRTPDPGRAERGRSAPKAAQRLVEAGSRYEYALQTLTEIQYREWRNYDPADSMRFYALRLHEAGMIQANPNEILAEGTDWRFLNELKRELKA
jgi:NitT/TauT family transport system substrate-binding protein